TPAAPVSRRAIAAMRAARSRVFSPARAASASWAAAPEARKALSRRRWSENRPPRKRKPRICSAWWSVPRRMRMPSRSMSRAVAFAASRRGAVRRAAGRRNHADQNGSRCAGRRSSTRRRLRTGVPVSHPRRRNLGTPGCPRNWEKRANSDVRRRHTPCKSGVRGSKSGPGGGGVPGALVLGVWLLAVPLGGGEPGLLETQEAAASAAGGSAALDAARLARARAAHWVPQLRGQATVREDEKTRLGEYRLAPLREQDAGAGRNWALTLTWDLSQVVFAREETQLAQTQAQLAKI